MHIGQAIDSVQIKTIAYGVQIKLIKSIKMMFEFAFVKGSKCSLKVRAQHKRDQNLIGLKSLDGYMCIGMQVKIGGNCLSPLAF